MDDMFPSVPARRPAERRVSDASLARRMQALMSGAGEKTITAAEERSLRAANRRRTSSELRELRSALDALPSVPQKNRRRPSSGGSGGGPREPRLTKACRRAFEKMVDAHEALVAAAGAYQAADKRFDIWMRGEVRRVRSCLASPSGEDGDAGEEDEDLAARLAALNVGQGELMNEECLASITGLADRQREIRRLHAAYKKADARFDAAVTKALREAKKCRI